MSRPTRKNFSPKPGPWFLSYAWVERGGQFPWPEPTEALYGDLASFLSWLSELPLDDVLKIDRKTGEQAVKSVLAAHDAIIDVMDRRGGDSDVALELFEFTYCLRYADPRRLFAIYEIDNRVMYPIMWDPHHEALGYNPNQRASSDPQCSQDCRHPQPAE